ncbi:MAG: autotransporter-associated beta strand repeat-containing protein [Planctomycetes bacterium]|nr:autotransporter-associated beta strand repeat-containing protein [Planctomycetota bacterium]
MGGAAYRVGASVVALAVIAGAMPAEAQTWIGTGGDGLWSTAGNWSSPPGSTAATLVFSGTTNPFTVNDGAVSSVGAIRFTNTTTSGSFVLAGATAVTVTGSIFTANGTAGTEEISFPITLGPTLVSVNVGGNGHFLKISGTISGNATSEFRKVVDNGRLILTANNTFIGKFAPRVGSVQFPKWGAIGDPSPLGAGNLPIEVGQAGNTSDMIYDGPGETTNRYIQVGMGASGLGGSTITNSGSGALVFTAASRPSHPDYGNNLFNQRQPSINAGINRTLTFQGSNSGSNTVASVIVDNNDGSARVGVTKAGSGRWILSGTNTYTGGTQVNAGTLVLDGLTGVAAFTNQVAVGATLAGSGTLSGPTTVSGILSPGGGVGSVGTLSFNASSFLWNSGSSASAATDWAYDLGAANQSDSISIVGPFTKSGTGSGYRFDFGGSTQLGTFTLASWTGTTSFLASDFGYTNLGGGNTATFDIVGTSLLVTVVPEPTTAVWLVASALSAGVIALRRRGER